MEEAIRNRYDTKLFDEIFERYGIGAGDIKELNGFESFIYEFTQNGSSYILRVAHTLRRSVNLIRGEVDWIEYLAKGGASVASAVPSIRGNLVEAVDDGTGGFFLATAFEKATGSPPRINDLKPAMFRRYGQTLGRIHALSLGYQPTHEHWRRFDWNHPQMLFAPKWLDSDEKIVLERYEQLLAYLDKLPRSHFDFGLIHQDAHYGNLFVDGDGCITLFDFDDCCYSWFANDVAIVLFYAVMGQSDEGTFTREFLFHFLQGYRMEMDLADKWLQEIPNFLKLREIDLYAAIHRSFDLDNIDNPWVAFYMNGRKERIEKNIPVIQFDFAELD